jgi:hypothetical protein
MPTLKNLLTLVAAMLSTSVALADTTDDRSYLPPQNLQARSKDLRTAPQAEHRVRGARYVRHNGRGPRLQGILRAIFR